MLRILKFLQKLRNKDTYDVLEIFSSIKNYNEYIEHFKWFQKNFNKHKNNILLIKIDCPKLNKNIQKNVKSL